MQSPQDYNYTQPAKVKDYASMSDAELRAAIMAKKGNK
jgi:hypothetical protein